MKRILILIAIGLLMSSVASAAQGGGGESTKNPAPTSKPKPKSAPKPRIEPRRRGSTSTPGVVVTTPSGLKYIDVVVGTGESPRIGRNVTVHYTGTLMNGTRFDSSRDPGKNPVEFVLGNHQMINGFEEGVSTMKVGGRRTLFIPPHLGHGTAGAPPTIPPNATVIYEVELVSVNGNITTQTRVQVPPAPTTADLTIQSTPPNSSILIDGQSIGVTDENGMLRVPSLNLGEHVIIGRKAGFRDAQLSIYLEVNRTQTAQLDLRPTPGTLNVSVNVNGARIEIIEHGNYMDKVSNVELDAGSYTINASKPGYRTAMTKVDIEAGLHSDVTLTLELAVEEILAEAEREFRNQNYNQAIAISRNILANNFNQPRANWLIGQSYFKMQKYYESIPYLANAISLGEQVIFPITHRHGGQFGFNVDDDLCVGRIIFGKNLLEFQSLTGITMSSVNVGSHNFRTTMGQIYELKFDNIDQGGEVHLVVGVDEKGKEKRKRYDLYSPQATLADKRSRSGQALGMIIRCNNCPEMMPALFQLLRILQSRQAKP